MLVIFYAYTLLLIIMGTTFLLRQKIWPMAVNYLFNDISKQFNGII